MTSKYKPIEVLKYDNPNTDLTVINAAKASMGRHDKEITPKGLALIKHLANHGHVSTFFHNQFMFEMTLSIQEFIKFTTWKIQSKYQFVIVGLTQSNNTITFLIRGSLYAFLKCCFNYRDIHYALQERCPHTWEVFQELDLIRVPDMRVLAVRDLTDMLFTKEPTGQAITELRLMYPEVAYHDAFQLIPMSTVMRMPVFTARQIMKTYMSVNEFSRRYVKTDPSYYKLPLRGAPPEGHNKQGSVKELVDLPIMVYPGGSITHTPESVINLTHDFYKHCLSNGVAPEIARGFLTQTMHVQFMATASLDTFSRVEHLRAGAGAQGESGQVAEQLRTITTKELTIYSDAYSKLYSKCATTEAFPSFRKCGKE